jgi:hypothetical protein
LYQLLLVTQLRWSYWVAPGQLLGAAHFGLLTLKNESPGSLKFGYGVIFRTLKLVHDNRQFDGAA